MKIDSVELHPAGSSEVVVMSFRDPSRSNPYNVKAISGLDAQDIVSRYYSGSEGSAKYNLALEKREPVILIGLNPRYDQGENPAILRDALYKMIASSRTGLIQMQFKNGSVIVAAVSGFISKMEAPQFSKSQEVQLTITCRDPMLRSLTPVELDVSSLDPGETEIDDILSTAPHGFKFQVTVTPPYNISSVTMYDTDDGGSSWIFVVSPSGGFLPGDVFYFSSEHNDKYVYMERDDETIFLADKIAPGSIWPIMFPGMNKFTISGGDLVFDWNAISYIPTYWGI